MENIFMIIKDKTEFFEALNEWEASKIPSGKPETKDPDELYLSQREAARFLRVSLPTLISWKKARKIPFYQHGRKVLFKKSEVLEAMKNSVM
ncbi:MAG: helix-turn-helix domain-containing protein [Bacteroidetes bacterium]|jgi:excisionase family DNA binding protein|nr:helix-turn-helix domain-containing protein [Bacteroidota bacterium]